MDNLIIVLLILLCMFLLGLLAVSKGDIKYLDKRLEEEKLINEALRHALNVEQTDSEFTTEEINTFVEDL